MGWSRKSILQQTYAGMVRQWYFIVPYAQWREVSNRLKVCKNIPLG